MALSAVLPISTLLVNATGGNVGYNNFIEKTVKIVRTCSISDQTSTILLAGEYEEFLQGSLIDNLSVALISESRSSAFDFFTLTRYSFTEFQKFSIHLLWKLNEFVIVASSQSQLRLLLQRIKDSTWANFYGSHILIDRETEVRGCSNAKRYLWVAWEHELLFSLFLCIDPVEGVLVYTYNPYSGLVPGEWQEAGRFKGRKGHPWVLMKRKYQDGSKMCKDLYFDKTTDLNGYEVRLNAVSFMPHLRIDPEESGLKRFSGHNGEIMKLVFGKLNATMNVMVYNGTIYDLGGVGSHGYPVGMLQDVDVGRVDIGMNGRSLYAMWNLENTYPHDQDGICVITRRAGMIPEFIKIMSFVSLPVFFCNVIIFQIACLLLMKHRGFILACMDIVRLMTMVSIPYLPRNVSGRIFFSTVFLLILIINSLIESHLASLLTLPVSRPNIQTPEDLKRLNYTIYGSKFYSQQIQDPVLRSRFREASYEECKQRVLDSWNSACLDDCSHLYVRIMNESQLFFRSQMIQQHLQVYVSKANWSLLDRVTKLIQSSVEAGIVVLWVKVGKMKTFRAWKKRVAKELRSYRTLKLNNVAFCFYVVLTGNSLASVVFVLEILVARYKSRVVRMFRRLFRRY